MSEFKEYKFKDGNDDIVVARKVESKDGETVLTPGSQPVHVAKGDFVVKIPASAYGLFEVILAKDSGLVLAKPATKPTTPPVPSTPER